MNGKGVFYFVSGNRYEGTFVDGKKNGQVVYTLRMGPVMRGSMWMTR